MKKTLALSLALALLLSILSGCGVKEPAAATATPEVQESAPAAESPVPTTLPPETAPPTETPQPEESAEPQPVAPAAGSEEYVGIYKPILDGYYDLLSQPINGEALINSDYCFLCLYCLAPLEDVGYSYMDLDLDGSMELIIACVSQEEFLSHVVFDVYCIEDGQPRLVLQSQERDRYYINYACDVIRVWSNSAEDSGTSLLAYQNGQLTEKGGVVESPTQYRDLGLTLFSAYAG